MTGRINDRLRQHFGAKSIFTDVDNMPAGVDFRVHLDEQVSQCEVLLAVIGKKWLTVKNKGQRRLDEPADYVRTEIESALQRKIRVVPLLVQNAGMPGPDSLPESIRDLAFRHGVPIRYDPDFHKYMNRLITDVSDYLKQLEEEEQRKAEQAAEAKRRAEEIERQKAATAKREQEEREAEQAAVAKRQAEEAESTEAKRKAEEEAQQSEEETRRKVEEEAKRKAERAAKRKVARKAKRKAEEAAKRKALLEPALQQQVGAIFRDKLSDGSEGPEMVVVPAGEFLMGSQGKDSYAKGDEKPQHRVKILFPFAVGRYPVIFDEYDRFTKMTNGVPSYGMKWGRGRLPVINVSWNDAKAYVEWLSEKTSKAYRLLSEAEWEYACRATTKTRYSVGDKIKSEDAHFYNFSRILSNNLRTKANTTEVGSYPANLWKLHDMHGNVFEWIEDVWHKSYEGAPSDGSAWLTSENSRYRVVRGGCWNTLSKSLRSALRYRSKPGWREPTFGFRVARKLT